VIVAILATLILAGLALWACAQLPIDPTILRLIRVVIIIAAVLYLLNVFGVLPDSSFHRFR
jgi:hypothetical protein